MNKLITLILFLACIFMTACNNDDEPKMKFTGEYLEATTWDAQLNGSAYPNHTPISSHFVIQFLTKQSGKSIPAYGDESYEGSFTYNISKNMITFNGSIVGNWTVIDQNRVGRETKVF